MCNEADIRAVGYSLFLELWQTLIPWIVIAKPSSDLCWTCQQFSETLANNPNLHDDEKQEMVQRYQEHLKEAKKNREYYKSQTKEAIESYKEKPDFSPFVPCEPCTFDGVAHYSWDYAQQLHYPTNPQQPGPIYFKTARKCGIFGIVNEASGTQFNYLIDEAVSNGKGANTTISYVHHSLECHGMGETTAYFHADNCTGKVKSPNLLCVSQNKKGFFFLRNFIFLRFTVCK